MFSIEMEDDEVSTWITQVDEIGPLAKIEELEELLRKAPQAAINDPSYSYLKGFYKSRKSLCDGVTWDDQLIILPLAEAYVMANKINFQSVLAVDHFRLGLWDGRFIHEAILGGARA